MELTTARDEAAIASHSAIPCRRCGEEIRGRRRNGYCSDKCRMAANRERDAVRRRLLVSRLREVVSEVEAEWFPRRDASVDE